MSCEIFVVGIQGKKISVCVDSEEELRNMTVKEFIRRVCPDDPYDEWRIIYINQILDHDRTLGYYGVSNKSTLIMIRHLPGGSGPPPDDDKGVPRTVSMERLANMQQEESGGWCRIM